ncbi:MAG: hypothetical protein NTV34_09275 [Proteobacteria bacterium]|nr:hypothetical protein [Pseudomonadota bacterium]
MLGFRHLQSSIARGTKTANLGGMNVLDGSIWRPLISVSRATIYTAMTTSGHGWREDSSNTKSVYARNRIRQEVIPVLDQIYPGATKRMASWAKNTGSSRPKDLGDAIASTGRLAGARLNDAKITAIADFIQNARLGQSMRISLSQWLICGEPRTWNNRIDL